LGIFEIWPAALTVASVALGLIVGSFLNVVAFRLPIMMQRAWAAETAEATGSPPTDRERFDLSWPRSHCPHCSHPIRAIQNIPVLSYLLLKGRCGHCQAKISARYPLVEALTAIASLVVAWRFGATWATPAVLVLTWFLIALSLIDLDHKLLPDSLTLPLVWIGMLLTLVEIDGAPIFAGLDIRASVIGAAAGYLSLWSVYQLFKLITGKEGMGYGDFKLLAAIGAWLGWKMLPLVILFASCAGALIGVAMIVLARRGRDTPIPFGPYLAIGGLIALFHGAGISRQYLGLF
jgi:leader peptidase (prepilin peptidase)/N-methyltransferase